MVDAAPGMFQYGNGQTYSPRNFDASESTGMVTARQALAHSINTATVRIAEMVGYDKVVDLAKAAGISGLQATPAMAIGSYDATPLIDGCRVYGLCEPRCLLSSATDRFGEVAGFRSR